MPSKTRRLILWPLIVIVSIVAIGVIGFDVMRRAATMQLATASAASIASAATGTQIKAVMRIGDTTGDGAMTAELLAAQGGSNYRETTTRLRLALSANTRFIMGAAADIRPGAIVQVDGIVDAPQSLHAVKIVVLNDYVHLVAAR